MELLVVLHSMSVRCHLCSAVIWLHVAADSHTYVRCYGLRALDFLKPGLPFFRRLARPRSKFFFYFLVSSP